MLTGSGWPQRSPITGALASASAVGSERHLFDVVLQQRGGFARFLQEKESVEVSRDTAGYVGGMTIHTLESAEEKPIRFGPDGRLLESPPWEFIPRQ